MKCYHQDENGDWWVKDECLKCDHCHYTEEHGGDYECDLDWLSYCVAEDSEEGSK